MTFSTKRIIVALAGAKIAYASSSPPACLDYDAMALMPINVQNYFTSTHEATVTNIRNFRSFGKSSFGMADLWKKVVRTRDWHPQNHISFAQSTIGSTANFSSNTGKWRYPNATDSGATHLPELSSANLTCRVTQNEPVLVSCHTPFEFQQSPFALDGNTFTYPQKLWPIHSVQNTEGAAYDPGFPMEAGEMEILKGDKANVEAYSAFSQPPSAPIGRREILPTNRTLNESNIKTVVFVGFTFDYSVKYSALDAVDFGFKSVVIDDYTASMDPLQLDANKQDLIDRGVVVMSSREFMCSLPLDFRTSTNVVSSEQWTQLCNGIDLSLVNGFTTQCRIEEDSLDPGEVTFWVLAPIFFLVALVMMLQMMDVKFHKSGAPKPREETPKQKTTTDVEEGLTKNPSREGSYQIRTQSAPSAPERRDSTKLFKPRRSRPQSDVNTEYEPNHRVVVTRRIMTREEIENDPLLKGKLGEQVFGSVRHTERRPIMERDATSGLRVVRGPNWCHGDQDGGDGRMGTLQVHLRGDWWMVVWDGSNEQHAYSLHELSYAQTPPAHE